MRLMWQWNGTHPRQTAQTAPQRPVWSDAALQAGKSPQGGPSQRLAARACFRTAPASEMSPQVSVSVRRHRKSRLRTDGMTWMSSESSGVFVKLTATVRSKAMLESGDALPRSALQRPKTQLLRPHSGESPEQRRHQRTSPRTAH